MTCTSELVLRASAELEKAGIERPLFEAQILMAIAEDSSRLEVLRYPERLPTVESAERFRRLVTERGQRVPLAYLRGTQEFHGLEFKVNPDVLIPRPETELLVDLAIERLAEREACRVVDVGTGSGCIAVAIAVYLTHIEVTGLDLSSAALAVASVNARELGVGDRVRFVESDLLDSAADKSAEMIVANPPYIPTEEIGALQPEVRDFEPRGALDGGADGLRFHARLIHDAPRVLTPGGMLAVEVACGQARQVESLMHAAGYVNIGVRPDLAGIERVVHGKLR